MHFIRIPRTGYRDVWSQCSTKKNKIKIERMPSCPSPSASSHSFSQFHDYGWWRFILNARDYGEFHTAWARTEWLRERALIRRTVKFVVAALCVCVRNKNSGIIFHCRSFSVEPRECEQGERVDSLLECFLLRLIVDAWVPFSLYVPLSGPHF